MRFLGEIAVLGLVLFLGWEKPFKYRFSDPPPPPPPVIRTVVRAAPTPTGDWMWDKTRTTTLDRGAYNRDNGVAGSAIITGSSPGPTYVDQNGRRYWIDQNGVRHYL